METVAECLAANIKKLREEHAMTQTQLAEKARISLVFLQGIESRKKWISPTTINNIARALHVSESRLFENCFAKKTEGKISKRLRGPKLDHIPDDIFNALATTCRKSSWKWESIRWIIEGYERKAR
jgi:transcriptional regulator with XRE-family HTH domain